VGANARMGGVNGEGSWKVSEHERGDVLDHSRVAVQDGVIHYKIRQQDGSFQPMTAPNTLHNRQIVSWIQAHD
jgi:hypothetical protein